MDSFEKILNDAKIISDALEDGADNGASNNIFSNMAQLTSMMDLIKSFRSIGQIPPPVAPAAVPSPVSAPISNNVGALLAMAPYMGETNKKNVIVASKMMELMHIVKSFEDAESVRAMSADNAAMDNRGMLLAARPYIEADKRDMVDLLITVMDISEILSKIERMKN